MKDIFSRYLNIDNSSTAGFDTGEKKHQPMRKLNVVVHDDEKHEADAVESESVADKKEEAVVTVGVAIENKKVETVEAVKTKDPMENVAVENATNESVDDELSTVKEQSSISKTGEIVSPEFLKSMDEFIYALSDNIQKNYAEFKNGTLLPENEIDSDSVIDGTNRFYAIVGVWNALLKESKDETHKTPELLKRFEDCESDLKELLGDIEKWKAVKKEKDNASREEEEKLKQYEEAINAIRSVTPEQFEKEYAFLATEKLEGDFREKIRIYLNFDNNDSHSKSEIKTWNEINEVVKRISDENWDKDIIVVEGKDGKKATYFVEKKNESNRVSTEEFLRQKSFRKLYVDVKSIVDGLVADQSFEYLKTLPSEKFSAESFSKKMVDVLAVDGSDGERIFKKILLFTKNAAAFRLDKRETNKLRNAIIKLLPAKPGKDAPVKEKVAEKENVIGKLPEKLVNVFVQTARKGWDSCVNDLSIEVEGESFLGKYDTEERIQLLSLLVKPLLREKIKEVRNVLDKKYDFNDEDEAELVKYVLDEIKK